MITGQTHLTAKGMEGSGLQVRLPSEVGYSRHITWTSLRKPVDTDEIPP